MKSLSEKFFIIYVKEQILNNINLLMKIILFICLKNLLLLK